MSPRRLGARVKGKDILFVEMGISDIGVARNNSLQDTVSIGLAKDLGRGDGVDRAVNGKRLSL